MYHSEIKNRIRQQHLLHSVMFELTYSCNLDCFFCYNDLNARGRSLSTEQYLNVFDELEAMNVLFITFTGGEPLVHKDFFKLGREARERGFSIRVKSNGHGIRGRIAKRLKDEVNPLQVEMSLHGASAATHDRQTRVSGSFDRLVNNISEMQELDLRPMLVSTLTSWNEHEVEQMYALADKLGVLLRFQGPVGPRDDGDMEPLKIQPSAEGWRQLSAVVNRRIEEAPPKGGAEPVAARDEDGHCGTGAEGILIDPRGNVFPCLQLRRSAGNLHEQTLTEIWQRSQTWGEARALSLVTAERVRNEGPLSTLGAPIFCPAMELKGCSTSCSKGCG